MSPSSGSIPNGVVIKGLDETVRHLKAFHKDIYDVLAKSVKAILERTRASAGRRYPQGSWTTSVGTARWPSGMITTTPGSQPKGSWSEAPGGVKAAVFDVMGRHTTGATPQAQATIASLSERYGKPQRFLWPAWLENREESMRDVQEALDRASDSLQAKLNGV